ncbi:MAG: hypothetical protein PHD05_03565, partial [Sphaerochaetaceae bacterium]|nr:hypothetical protein [Sphaerochaetaceae bacterium]
MVNEVSNNCNHKKLNRKAQQLIKKGNYQEAFALYSEYIPYFHFDEDDKKACIILSDIYEHYFENEYESQRLRNIGRDSNSDLIKFMNDNLVFSKDTLLFKNNYYIDLLSILYINNRFTETAIVYSVCTYLDICIPEQLDKLIL